MSSSELFTYVEKLLEMGITTFDHADIYGNYECEALFGEALKLKPELRSQIQLVTKCGIVQKYDHLSKKKFQYYDTGYEHIMESVNRSLSNFNTDYIDLLLIHRPDPLMNPEETARAFKDLKASGKVLNFGVSNFTISDFEMLNKFCDEKLITNQVEISPYDLEHFANGNISFFLKEGIHPMAWSPLAGGKLIHPDDEESRRIHRKLSELAERLHIESIDILVYAWLLRHPAGIIPILGTGKIERVRQAVKALEISLNTEDFMKPRWGIQCRNLEICFIISDPFPWPFCKYSSNPYQWLLVKIYSVQFS
jgi:predicted oxidoreductase